MTYPVVVDGRNLLDPESARAAGFRYVGVGRGVPPGPTHAEERREVLGSRG
jgi:hypothetical protein